MHTRAAEDQLHLSLGTPVEIKRKGKGGTISIAFTNETELQRIYEYLTERNKSSHRITKDTKVWEDPDSSVIP